MTRRMTSVLFVVLLATAPVTAAAPADRGTEDLHGSDLISRVWTGLLRWIGMEGGDIPGRGEPPRSLAAADDGGPHNNPDG